MKKQNRYRLSFQLLAIFFALIALASSCTDEPDTPPPGSGKDYSDGVFVINEGIFGTQPGTITYINRDGTGLEQKVYQKANLTQPLGDVVQSMTVIDDRVYIAVNNSNRIVIASLKTMQEIETIEGISKPRFIAQIDESHLAVSSWDDAVNIYNLDFSGFYFETYPTKTGPEKMMKINEELWILNQGGLSVDSSITIIDLVDHGIENLSVFPRPTGIVQDSDGFVWVLCSGRAAYHPGGNSSSHLLKIDAESHTILLDYIFPDANEQANHLLINHGEPTLFVYWKNGIYYFNLQTNEIAPELLVDLNHNVYAMGYNDLTNTIYVTDALDYVQSGDVYKYDANTGDLVGQFKAGLNPGFLVFTNNN